MTKTKFDETYIFKISIKIQFFKVSLSIEIPFFRVSFTIEPGRSLLQFVTTNCLISPKLVIGPVRDKIRTVVMKSWGVVVL